MEGIEKEVFVFMPYYKTSRRLHRGFRKIIKKNVTASSRHAEYRTPDLQI
jgi:hypothetical protein